MGLLKELSLESADLAQNPATRLPVCLCVDVSYSMRMDRRIQQVNQGIRRFLDEIAKNYYAVDSVELCIVSFGGTEARVEHPFAPVQEIEFQDLQASGSTPLGKAVTFALSELQFRQERYRDHGITTYRPWLILLSDGAATDDIREAAAKVLELQKQREIKVLCIGLGDEENSLAEFHAKKQVIHLKDFELDNFFAWLSKSMSKQSQESPYEDLDVPYMSGLQALEKKG